MTTPTVKPVCSQCMLPCRTDAGGRSACCAGEIAEVQVDPQSGFRTAATKELLTASGTVSWIRCPIGQKAGLIDINEKPYFLTPGQAGAYRLRPAESDEVYVVQLDFEHCTCRDARHRPSRPGGCKHVKAIRALLGTIRF